VTPLEKHLKRRIALEGPMTVAGFMAEALTHPQHGYYVTRDPLGAAGDFITAPEISQVFGELVGLWLAEAWRQSGSPTTANLVELGPGRGTLMADILRVAKMMPGFEQAVSVHLVEASPPLRGKQREALGDRAVTWHDSLETVPDGPTFLIANEFFDALPIHQLMRTEEGWRERVVAVQDDDTLIFGLSPGASPLVSLVPPDVRDSAKPGEIFELSPVSIAIMRQICSRISTGGAALIIDYGHPESATGDTLQAVSNHEFADILAAPGSADITAHVDFEMLARAAREEAAVAFGPVAQGSLLTRLGIDVRRQQLSKRVAPAQAKAINSAIGRLIGPKEMGTLFKALAVLPAGAQTPPGFEEPA